MGLLKTAAKVAVASHVHGRVQRRQSQRWAAQDAAAAVSTPTHTSPHPVPPAAQPTQGATGADDMLARLAKLGELRAAGVLTDAEFETQKAKILAE
jgi:hypothetical protein